MRLALSIIKLPIKIVALMLAVMLTLLLTSATFITAMSAWIINLFSGLCFLVGIGIYLTGLADGHEALSVLAVGCIAYCVPIAVSTILVHFGKIRLDLGRFLRL